jgi:hypothetical protein
MFGLGNVSVVSRMCCFMCFLSCLPCLMTNCFTSQKMLIGSETGIFKNTKT